LERIWKEATVHHFTDTVEELAVTNKERNKTRPPIKEFNPRSVENKASWLLEGEMCWNRSPVNTAVITEITNIVSVDFDCDGCVT
jgi:hypothetical protein